MPTQVAKELVPRIANGGVRAALGGFAVRASGLCEVRPGSVTRRGLMAGVRRMAARRPREARRAPAALARCIIVRRGRASGPGLAVLARSLFACCTVAARRGLMALQRCIVARWPRASRPGLMVHARCIVASRDRASGARLAAFLVSCALVALLAPAVQAHHVRRTALYVDFGARSVALELRIPLEELSFARGKLVKLTNWKVDPSDVRELSDYVRAHLSVRARRAGQAAADGGGQPFALEVGEIAIETDNLLVVHAVARSPQSEPIRAIELRYDGITDRVTSHETNVFVRRDLDAGQLGDEPKLYGGLHWQRRSIEVKRAPGDWTLGFGSMFMLGIDHIQHGTDHLLFLLMLLLPAPLLVRGWRWAGPRPVMQSLRATFWIVTAFTLGHSLTLIAGAAHGAALPAQPVEVLIACSILISAAHAFRPLFAGREMFIAAGFGLVHGLAFARELLAFGFDGRSLALALFGFNLGIETMQLCVVLVVLPWLLLASRNAWYAPLRVAGATFGVIASAGWIAERAFGWTSRIPALVETAALHAAWILAALVLFTLASGTWSRLRRP